MNRKPHCYTIPPGGNFLHSLAGWILGQYAGQCGNYTSAFTKILILLPNRRSCRALRDAFLDCSGGKPLLLPRIQPIGEIESEFLLSMFGADIKLPDLQPVDPVRRHFLLMKLIMAFQQSQASGGMAKQASELARQLADFMDEVNREGISFGGLTRLTPENLAAHWQQTLDFLAIITKSWPKLLAQEGVVDIITHRNQILAGLARMWEASPPDYPVIAAGSTGSQPATFGLLKVISRLPGGRVVLPALDKEMPKQEWQQVKETHPQYGLKKLLENLEISRGQVEDLILPQPGQREKDKCIRSIFAPPEATSNWAKLDLPAARGLAGIKFLEADTLLDEASFIAISLREVLETPGKTAALVTPDRTLARMVCANLQRFGVIIDDSAGKPLAQSPPGSFLRLVMEMVSARAAPASLLALLRHPLTGAGINLADCRRLSRELETALLRGIRRDSGLKGLRDAAPPGELKDFLAAIEEKAAAFSEFFIPHCSATLKQLLAAHIDFAQWLAGSDTQDGAQVLWSGDAGNALAEIIAQWSMQSEVLPPIDTLTYPALFNSLLAGETYRTQAGLHPRLHILGPLEARLQSYDKVILGSLNEGTWPQNSKPDPWMSRTQRIEFGLPVVEHAIGQSAHDLVMLLYAPEVLLTRARKVEGAPAVPSRWWVRIKTLVGGKEPGVYSAMNGDKYFSEARDILEKPANLPLLAPPAPAPALPDRSRKLGKLRVTAIDRWLNDPYSIYASHILELNKLEELDREPAASDFGNLVHKALERFTANYPEKLPPDCEGQLLACGRNAFADFLDRPSVACLWWPRFVAMANWLVKEEKKRRSDLECVYSEVKAHLHLNINGENIILSTRIDRLEKKIDGSYVIIDYKTGAIPKNSSQLPLEALIIQSGKAEKVAAGTVAKMEYWKLSGNEVKCEIKAADSGVEEAQERLIGLISNFYDHSVPFAAQSGVSSQYNDYEHLARRQEWEAV